MSKYPNRQVMFDYLNNRANAKRRNIGFYLTFEQWWFLWEKFYDNRGIGKDKYQLCRKGDVGDYTIDNCYIATQQDNLDTMRHYRKVADYQEIKDLKGKLSAKDIASIYKIHPRHVHYIWRK